LPIFLLAAGTLLGAAAGGSLGYVAAGLTGASIVVGVGALAGLGIATATSRLIRPTYWYPIWYPYCGYYYCPVFYVGPPSYYTTAV
jgi:hypothetical protein